MAAPHGWESGASSPAPWDSQTLCKADLCDADGDGVPTLRRTPRSWWAYWDRELRGSPVLGALNIICCVVGVGLLGLPYALKSSGWIGVPLLLTTCAMSTFTCVLLGDVLQAVDGAASFGDLGFLAFGRTGRWAVAAQQYVTMVGVAAIFLVVLASGLRQVLPSTYPDCSWNITAAGMVVSLHVFFNKLSDVALLSAFNLIVAVLIAGTVCWYSFTDARPDAHTQLLNSDRTGAYNYEILVAFPTITFAFGCHTILPAVREELRDKRQFPALCRAAVPATLLLYLPVAVGGYWAFGDHVADPIFKNFHSAVGDAVILLLLAHVAMSYAIMMNPPERALEEEVLRHLAQWTTHDEFRVITRHRWSLRLALRLLLTSFTVIIARVIPCFPVLVALIAATAANATSFLFPVLFYLRLSKDVDPARRIACFLTLLVSVAGGLTGVYNALRSLADCHLGSDSC
jgi:vesicular inhibitory amino acid transporter